MISYKSVDFRRVRCENMMFVSRKVNREFEFTACDQKAAQNVGTNHRGRVLGVKSHGDVFKGDTICLALVVENGKARVKESVKTFHNHWVMVFSREDVDINVEQC